MDREQPSRVVFVHGACVQDGAWWWHRTAALLDAHGVVSAAPALPSCGETGATPGADGPGFAEDVASVRETLLAGDAPTVLVVHSYGGIVAAEAAAGVASVSHLLLISSYLPEPGEGLFSFGPDEPAPFLAVDPDAGTLAVDPAQFAETFVQDCDADVQRDAATRLTTQSLGVVGAPVAEAAWKQLPTTYLVCTQDRGTSAERQRRYAERADRVVDVDAGHHPFLSQPEVVRDLILGLRP